MLNHEQAAASGEWKLVSKIKQQLGFWAADKDGE